MNNSSNNFHDNKNGFFPSSGQLAKRNEDEELEQLQRKVSAADNFLKIADSFYEANKENIIEQAVEAGLTPAKAQEFAEKKEVKSRFKDRVLRDFLVVAQKEDEQSEGQEGKNMSGIR